MSEEQLNPSPQELNYRDQVPISLHNSRDFTRMDTGECYSQTGEVTTILGDAAVVTCTACEYTQIVS